jgi:hypothetical protein
MTFTIRTTDVPDEAVRNAIVRPRPIPRGEQWQLIKPTSISGRSMTPWMNNAARAR